MFPDIAASISALLGWVLREQCRCRHDLTRLAVAALHDLEVEPRLLYLLAGRRLPDRLDGGDFLAGGRGHRGNTRADRLAVELHGAGPAQRHAAAELRAGQADDIAQRPQDRHVRGHVHGLVLTVDVEGDHGRVLPSRLYVSARRISSAAATAVPARTDGVFERPNTHCTHAPQTMANGNRSMAHGRQGGRKAPDSTP